MSKGGICLVVLLAPPGSGKGTLSEMLQERDDFRVLSAGKILRTAFAKKSEKGNEADDLKGVHQGKYLGDDVVNKYIIDELDKICEEFKDSPDKLFISLDGYPRTIGQAERLVNWAVGKEILVVKFDGLSLDDIWARLSHRYLCEAKEHIFNSSFGLPENLVCPKDGSRLIRREDDASIELVEKRLLQHNSLTAPVWEYFCSKGCSTFVIDSRKTKEELYISFKQHLSSK